MGPPPARTAEPRDVDAIVRLVNLAFQAERPYIEGDRASHTSVLELLSRGTFLLLENEGMLVACIYIEGRGRFAYLGLVSVDPPLQGLGLGTQVMAAAEAHCRAAGYEEVLLRFINHRTELRRFYERLGFRDTGILDSPDLPGAKVPFHFVEMSKSLR